MPTVTTTPSTIYNGAAESIQVGNTGTVAAKVTAAGRVYSLLPGRQLGVHPKSAAVTAVTTSGSTTVQIDDGSAPQNAVPDGTVTIDDLDAATAAKVNGSVQRAGETGTVDLTTAAAVRVPTATLGDNTTKAASTAFTQAAIDALVAAAPGAMNTLKELADAFGDDPNFAATTATALAARVSRTGETGAVNLSGAASVALPAEAIWNPSDPTGVTDMTAELEAFRLAHLGHVIKVAQGATILLNNAFATATTGDILLDFTGCTIKYDNTSSYAIACDNTANASAEVAVSSMSNVTVNSDAYVTRLTIPSTLNLKRFDWVAIYCTDVNPAKSGGQYGEIAQTLADEASLHVDLTRKLNKYGVYVTNVKVRKLDATRRVSIRGGTFTANGNTEDALITTRAQGIRVLGFVAPEVKDVTFDHPWARAVLFQACARPKASGIRVQNVGNLASSTGYTYGVTLYGMVDGAVISDLSGMNGRHPAFTTDGNSSNSATWYNKGIPTNATVDGVRMTNCHGAPVDTHEEGDNIVIKNVVAFHPAQDADIAAASSFTGTGMQLRCSNITVQDAVLVGGQRGIKVPAVDHGTGGDRLILKNVIIKDLASSGDTDTGIQIDDQDGLTNKRHIVAEGVAFENVGLCWKVGKSTAVTVVGVVARRFDTYLDAAPGATVIHAGQSVYDYRNNSRTAPYFGCLMRSDGTLGGCTVLFLKPPVIIKGTDATPVEWLTESDTTASKTYYLPSLTEYNPSAVTATLLKTAGSTTLAASTAVATAGDEAPSKLSLSTATTKGDLLVATASGVVARHGVGNDGEVLLSDSGATRGVAWGPTGNPRPRDRSLLGWSHTPDSDNSNQTATAGTLYMRRVKAERSGNATKLYMVVSSATTPSPTANQCFMGLFSTADRSLIVATAAGNIDAQLAGASPYILTGTIASSAVVAGTEYFVGFFWNGTGTIQLLRGNANGLVNLNLSGNGLGFAVANTGLTTTVPNPAASLTANTASVWAGIG